MFERLGLVAYWIGSALAVLLFIGGIPAALYESSGQSWTVFLFFCGFAGTSWLIGRAIKFILVGK